MKKLSWILPILLLVFTCQTLKSQGNSGTKLHIVIIGAHPDDPEKAAGTAAKWIQKGCDVTMVAVTNGDAGHQTMNAKDLAARRKEEARKAGEVIGAKYIVMDNHDGQLMPTYENRMKIIKVIREARADIVIFPRPYDYHPDHRYTGVLVCDAAYMVTVPTILPEVPFLKKNPVFLYMEDSFTHPEAFKADVAIDIDDVVELKMDMYNQHTSQMYEWLPFNQGILDQVPATEKERRAWLGRRKEESSGAQFIEKLTELYGKEKASKIKYCEAFQDSEYGTRLTKENIKYYFPFF